MQSEIERLEEQRDAFSSKYKKAEAELEREQQPRQCSTTGTQCDNMIENSGDCSDREVLLARDVATLRETIVQVLEFASRSCPDIDICVAVECAGIVAAEQ